MTSGVELAVILTAKDLASPILHNVAGKFSALGTAGKIAVAGVAAVGTAVIGTISGLVALANNSARTAGEVRRLARETGLTAIEASKLRYIGERLGLSTDDLSKSFGKLSMNIEGLHPHLAKYNIAVVRGKDGNVDMAKTLANVADRFKSMPDGVEKTALSMQIFGKTGKDMIPLLNKGAAGLREMGEEAKRLGLVFDDTALNSALRYSKSQKDIGEAVEGLKNKLGMAFLPVLADVATALSSFATAVLPPVMAGIDKFRGFAETAVGVFKELVDVFTRARPEAGGILASLIGHKDAAAFMKIVTDVSLTLNHFLETVIKPAFKWLQEHAPIIWANVTKAIGDAWAKIEPKLEAFGGKLGELKVKFDALPVPVKSAMEELAVGAVVAKTTGLDTWINDVSNALQGAGGLSQAIGAMTGKWKAFGKAVGTKALIIADIALVTEALWQVSGAVTDISDNWEPLRKAVHDGTIQNTGLLETFLRGLVLWGDAFNALGTLTQQRLAEWGEFFHQFGLTVKSIWPSIVQTAQQAWTIILVTIQNAINSAIDAINPFWTKLGNPPIPHIKIELPNTAWADAELDRIARDRTVTIKASVSGSGGDAAAGTYLMANGGAGVVSRPTMFLAGEAGPEHYSFTPLGRGRGGGGGVTINISGDVVGLSKTELAEELGRIWTQQRRLQGLSG
jgi:phage-related protein